jgi:hypothetical protein
MTDEPILREMARAAIRAPKAAIATARPRASLPIVLRLSRISVDGCTAAFSFELSELE